MEIGAPWHVADVDFNSGVTVLLVEQNVHQTLAIADYGYVLMQGRVVASGAAKKLRNNMR